jgi:hypothetical protein
VLEPLRRWKRFEIARSSACRTTGLEVAGTLAAERAAENHATLEAVRRPSEGWGPGG